MTKRLGYILLIGVLLLSPWILSATFLVGGEIYGKYTEWRYRPTDIFREAEWKRPDGRYRYSVLDYVISKIVSVGMTEEEVKIKLGEPDSISGDEWQYETKKPGWRVIDFSGGGLLLKFDSAHKVSGISKNTWVD